MRIGIPRERKNHEYRVAAGPAGVREMVDHGHRVVVETQAGAGSSYTDDDYVSVGAEIARVESVWSDAELVLKVKEPIAEEYSRLGPDRVLFAYLHLAASAECTDALLRSGVTAVAYETVRAEDGTLPLLAPMSEVAGRLATQAGAYHLMAHQGGRGVLMGGVPGVAPASVVVLGAGVSGANAVAMAVGLGAHVTVLDLDVRKLRALDARYGGRVTTVVSTAWELERAVVAADLVIGAVLVPGHRAPTLVSNALVARMRPGSVLVDIAIDQGGCFEDSRPTTHDDPTFTVHGSVFYCVANMPGSVPRTSTQALTNATLPYVLAIADLGWDGACRAMPGLRDGLAVRAGELVGER